MPGVPSSRGCDACRKQKKKCDQAKPACSRCARLKIECTGSGQQRYKFHNNTVTQPPSRKRSPGTGSGSGFSVSPSSSSSQLTVRPTYLPALVQSSAQGAIIGQLVSALQVSDPRFDLSVYGCFMSELPQRLGSSPALDAAASALASTLPLVLTQTGTNDYDKSLQPVNRATVPMLKDYGRALQALRTALCDPVTVTSPNTLCALYLVVVTQGWLQGDGGHLPSHGEAVAMILRAIQQRQPDWANPSGNSGWGSFEKTITSTLCFLVIMESFINPRIKLDDELWQIPEPHGPPSPGDEPVNIESLNNRFLAYIVKILREPAAHQLEIIDAYHRVRIDRNKLATLLESLPVAPSPSSRGGMTPVTEALCRIQLRWQTAYAMLTLIAMRIGSVLSHAVPLPESMDAFALLDLPSDFKTYTDDIVDTASQALQYYPLGSSFMPLCLVAAYSSLPFTGDDPIQRTRILRLFSEYRPGASLDREVSDVSNALQPHRALEKINAPLPSVACQNGDLDDIITQSDMCTIL